MNRLWCQASLLTSLLVTVSVFGQSLVAPERIVSERQLFQAAESAPQLRCEFHAVRPALNFAFRFETGYMIDVPLTQIHGQGHGLTIHVRVTPDGHEPVYLTTAGILPDVPETNAIGEIVGAFIVGDGTYDVEAQVYDDLHRFCRGAWQIQARREGSEQQLQPATPPGAVGELLSTFSEHPDTKPVPRIARLTVLVHAAPLSPKLSKLQFSDIQTLVYSLTSLLRELPAQSVRLIAFNLDQRAIIFRKDGFEANQMGDLKAALQQIDLAKVDYRTLRQNPEPLDLLLRLVQEELGNPNLPNALIVMGPRTHLQKDLAANSPGKRSSTALPVFFLQFQSNRSLLPGGRSNPPLRLGQGPLGDPTDPEGGDDAASEDGGRKPAGSAAATRVHGSTGFYGTVD